MSFIEARKISYEYKEYDDEEREIGTVKAVNDVSFTIDEGSFVVILGHNGSGKSTLAKQLNALLLPTEGTVFVSGRDTKDPAETLNIRREVGMIFQNPDNQIVAAVVEEDVAFGPENMGVPNPELQRRVSDAIGRVGMLDYLDSPPEALSGGQKQRIAIAGLLAMKPKCIVMDEPTAMLDPVGRKEVLETVHELNRSEGITVILITHNMEEAVDADRILVMDRGRFVMDGTPREIFSRVDELEELRLTVPEVTELANELKKEGVPLPGGILTTGELVEALEAGEGFGK